MFDFLDNIRKKPEAARRKILHASVGVSFFLIMAVWVGTIAFQLGEGSEPQQIANAADSPMSTLGQTASAFWGSVGGSLEKGKEAYENIKTEITANTN